MGDTSCVTVKTLGGPKGPREAAANLVEIHLPRALCDLVQLVQSSQGHTWKWAKNSMFRLASEESPHGSVHHSE